MTTDKTPAQQAGFVLNTTHVKLTGNDGDYDEGQKGKIYVMSVDDGSSCPYFDSVDGEVSRLCAYVRDMSIVQQPHALPKFPIGSRVKLVAGGWGFPPERIGEVFTVLDFTLGTDYTVYKVADESGQPVSASPWEPSFEAAPAILPPPVDMSFLDDFVGVPAIPSAYTDSQQIAINVFQAMYDAAVAYRNGATDGLAVKLNPDYGICDNIDRFANANGSRETPMSEVKENLIRQTEIYSGNYTYPVPCPDGGDASSAFSRHGNKWNGPYGLNRLIQLGQLIALIKSDKWDDSMLARKTPAFRNGLTVGDMVMYTRRTDVTYWILRHDDESMSPSFHRVGDPTDYSDLDLNYIRKVDNSVNKERSVSQFLEELKAKQEEQDALNKQIAELQAALTENKNAVALLDFGLAQQHKVKRIS